MAELLPIMLERAGLLVIVAFLLSRLKAFRRIVDHDLGIKEKIILALIFGCFGIVSNYTGVEIHHGVLSQTWGHDNLSDQSAIANTRVMGVGIGGLLGGPIVGIGAGLIAGLHRFTLGGFTALSCSLSTVLAGAATGFLGRTFDIRKKYACLKAVVIGALMEIVQMGIILLMAKPFSDALVLVKVIAVPMITINGFGTLLFMLIIQTILTEEERTRRAQTHNALYIAQQTLPFFRRGLNVESCQEVAKIMLKNTSADAISITDRERVLAHVGAASDHHIPLKNMSTQLTRRVLAKGKVLTAMTREDIRCSHPGCPLQSAIVLPLIANQRIVGTLKLYFTKPRRVNLVEKELAEGLSKLFSMQLALAEAELERKLLKDAEIKALQAQVHPHFLFNAINTISCLIRTDAAAARKLLIQLGVFFRRNLQGARQRLIPLEKELEHVEAYLALEQARFPGRYIIEYDIYPEMKKMLIPPFTLQPLVENAIHHAFAGLSKGEKGKVLIRAQRKDGFLEIATEDDGSGIPEKLLDSLGARAVASAEGTGTALWNIRNRMDAIYGRAASMSIKNLPDKGTRISIVLPAERERGEEDVQSVYR